MPDGTKKYGKHAERAALQLADRIGGRIRRVVVMRWTKDGALALSKPCEACQIALYGAGVRPRDVWYSTDEGTLERLG